MIEIYRMLYAVRMLCEIKISFIDHPFALMIDVIRERKNQLRLRLNSIYS